MDVILIVKGALPADNEYSDQTVRMRRLICVFVWAHMSVGTFSHVNCGSKLRFFDGAVRMLKLSQVYYEISNRCAQGSNWIGIVLNGVQ